MNTAKFMRERLVQYSRYKFKNFDKNTPESRTRLTLDITVIIGKKFGLHLSLPLFTF